MHVRAIKDVLRVDIDETGGGDEVCGYLRL